ncbi:hypothetical protein ZWY2020_036478 [Hordeum vulgare]|nr:hypothetical protein ZWY2020_036478 [Hordeum vulgare]
MRRNKDTSRRTPFCSQANLISVVTYLRVQAKYLDVQAFLAFSTVYNNRSIYLTMVRRSFHVILSDISIMLCSRVCFQSFCTAFLKHGTCPNSMQFDPSSELTSCQLATRDCQPFQIAGLSGTVEINCRCCQAFPIRWVWLIQGRVWLRQIHDWRLLIDIRP